MAVQDAYSAAMLDHARDWKREGLNRLERDEDDAAIDALFCAVSYGDDDAMMWLAIGFLRTAMNTDDSRLYLGGLGWAAIATLAGVERAHEVFCAHYDAMPDHLRGVWMTATPYTWAGLSVH